MVSLREGSDVNKEVRKILNRKLKEFQEETAHLVTDVTYAPETIATLLEFCSLLHIIMYNGDKALWDVACKIVFEKMNKLYGPNRDGSGNGNDDDVYH